MRQVDSHLSGKLPGEAGLADVKSAVQGVINIFMTKYMRLPSGHAIKAFELLVGLMQSQYGSQPVNSPTMASNRAATLELFCKMRADTLGRICLVSSDGSIKPSPYLLCAGFGASREREDKQTWGTTSPCQAPMSPGSVQFMYDRCKTTVMNVAPVFTIIIQCLKTEKEWPVLQVVLSELPNILQNKTFVLAASAKIEQLSEKLCSMATDRRLGVPDSLCNTPPKFSRSDFQGYLYPILASLASYHAHLDKSMQVTLIKSLEEGRLSKRACMCVNALTVCTLEMQETMMRQLPEVLLRLSQISATKSIAISMLEFLACLIHLPRLYANFVEEQYMSVFAIAAPYTNPAKFTHYTASLAHQVIALWFIKCRIIFRKDFVRLVSGTWDNQLLLPWLLQL